MSGLVLVTGAAGGQQGGTGRQVAELLLGQGIPVRAFVRVRDERAERLRELGADVVIGDLRDVAAVDPAMSGVDQVFFTYPVVVDGLLDATAAVATAAKRAGVRRLVEVSQLRPRPTANSPRTRQHWLSEQVFDWAGVGAIHLRATVFYENIRVLVGLADGGRLEVPLGDRGNLIPLVSARDVARMAAALLADPDRAAEPAYHLVGAVPTIGELVADFGVALGRSLEYVNVDERQWREWARGQGWPQHTIEHLSRLWQVFANTANRDDDLWRVTDVLERVTGAPPESVRDFLRAVA